MSEDERYLLEGDDEGNMSTTDAEKGDEGSGLQKRRKKSPSVLLTDEQERMLGQWLQEHPFLYDRGLTCFREVAKKTRLLAEKAKSLDPPLTGPQLSTWLRSIRTRYARLTKGKSSRAAERDLTEREKWILSEFKFFRKHIFRHRKPKTRGLKEVCKKIVLPCIGFTLLWSICFSLLVNFIVAYMFQAVRRQTIFRILYKIVFHIS